MPRTGDSSAWRWGLTLSGYGYAGRMQTPLEAELIDTANRMEYRRGGLVEWYVNDSRGIEQGFTLAERPPTGGRERGALLQIEMEILGSLCAGLDPGSGTVRFQMEDGAEVLNYGELYAYDATGRTLPARFDLNGERLTIAVDDGDAVYPVVIDPLASTPVWTHNGDASDDAFGISVATAGDVNGDGYSDVIVGAYQYDGGETDEGAAYVFLGNATGVNTGFAWSDEGDQTFAGYGRSVATAGDVNGDGYSDIIVGAPFYHDTNLEEGAAYVYHGSSTGLSATPDWSANSEFDYYWMGWKVGTAGDVNGDGYSDVIIALGEADQAWVWHGSSSGLGPDGTSSNVDWYASVPDDQITCSAATAGDVNGDGYSDVIVGVPTYDNGENNEGAVYVWFGSSTGLGSPGSSANADWSAESNVADAKFGSEVATAGDVNGDGYADIIVGAHRYTNGQTDEGAVYVFHGSSGGPSSTADWMIESDTADLRLGRSVGTAGDVNGDGFADVVIGAAKYVDGTPTSNTEGWAYLYYGAATGLDGTNSWSESGGNSEAAFGFSVATAGDVNGDGYSDVIIGAPGYTTLTLPPKVNAGRASVYLGSAGGLTGTYDLRVEGPSGSLSYGAVVSYAGDVNGDGFGDVIVGDYGYNGGAGTLEGGAWVYLGSGGGLSTTAAWSAVGGAAYTYFGSNVSTAGDVNGDGYDDIIVGTGSWTNPGGFKVGRVWVYHGSSSGLSTTADWSAVGTETSAYFGIAVASAGDVNGDGYGDVIVGATNHDEAQIDEGAVFLWYGSSSGLGPPGGTPANADWYAVAEQDNANLGCSVDCAGDVNGDGYSDIIAGCRSYDNGQTDEGTAFVWFGSASGPSNLAGKSTVSDAEWFAQGDQDNAEFGNVVSSAGDVNGDGYSDVLVAAHHYNDTYSGGGAAFVWYGSASGLGADGTPANADWGEYGTADYAYMGNSVDCAGDVNGDGYADIIVGQYNVNYLATGAGSAFAYYGSETGLGDLGWVNFGPGEGTDDGFGFSVSSAGDINGDGYADVVVGEPGYSGSSSGGRIHVFHGGYPRRGLNVGTRQNQPDSSPMAQLNMSDSPAAFRLRSYARTPYGRGLVKMEWEVKELGSLFDGTGTGQSPDWTDVGASGTAINNLVSGLSDNTVYHWRARFLYHPAALPFQPHSRWFTVPVNGWQEADFRTPPEATGVLEDPPPSSVVECVAFPNPFNPVTTIRFYLPAQAQVTLEIFDVSGRRVT
ncbi:MAG: FG-GAP-like repeat-containing protein, partial [Candidatus Latescibacterota bacterium]